MSDPAQSVHEYLTREIPTGRISSPAGVLSVAALLRCAHLLDAMRRRFDGTEDPLLALGLRDVIETAINGLFCVVAPDEAERFFREDSDARHRIAEHLGAKEHFATSTFALDYAELVDDAPRNLSFPKRVDRIWRVRPEWFGDEAGVGLVKAMHKHLCNFAMHGGPGVLDNYVVRERGELRLRPEPEPPTVDAAGAVQIAEEFTTKLHRAIRDSLD